MFIAIASLVLAYSTITQSCMRSSLYYRAKTRTRSHVFAPGEYQPRQWEHTVEGSGPLDSRDFQRVVPNKWLVRVDSPLIIFDSEEARWMTEGCRDRLIKLATQVQNTWANQNIKLRVIRGWIKPPSNYKSRTSEYGAHNGVPDEMEQSNAEASLLFDSRKRPPEHQKLRHKTHAKGSQYRKTIKPVIMRNAPHFLYEGIYPRDKNRKESQPYLGPIVDMTPEMMVDEEMSPRQTADAFQNNEPNEITSFNRLRHAVDRKSETQWTPWRSVQWSEQSRMLHPSRGYRSFDSVNLKSDFIKERFSRQPRDLRPVMANVSVNTARVNTEIPRLITRSAGGMEFYSSNRNTQPVNVMSQERFQQWLDMRMEEFHYAGRAVDLHLTKSVYVSPKEFNLGVLAQIAYYVAQFDWCYYNRRGHIHCSVKPDSSITSQWFGCFPGSAKLRNEHGNEILMKDLKLGDQILSRNLQTGELVTTEVVAFMHREEYVWKSMARIAYQRLQNNSTLVPSDRHLRLLYLTPNHLIYTRNQQSFNSALAPVFAGHLKPGDIILLSSNQTKLVQNGIVINVTLHMNWQPGQLGLYAPLTKLGTMIVDDVLVSCFAQFKHVALSRLATWPMQVFHQLFWWCDRNRQTSEVHGVHWYLKILYRLTSSILPSSLFYQEM